MTTQDLGHSEPSRPVELAFGTKWTVFGPVAREARDPDLAAYAAWPATLTVGGHKLSPKTVTVTAGMLDLCPLHGPAQEGRTAYVFIPINAPKTGEYFIGIGADWWFSAWVDGKAIGDTLATGNGFQPPGKDDNEFNVRLDAGEHTLAVKLISGSRSTVLTVGVPVRAGLSKDESRAYMLFRELTSPGWDLQVAYFEPATGAVPNPGMGACCYVYSDHMVATYAEWKTYKAPRPLDRATFDRMMALEHCDNVYIRPEWRDIQKEPGKLCLPDYWEWTIEACRRLNKRWSFRIQQAMPQSIHAHSVPEFLIPKLSFIPYKNQHAWGPETKYFTAYDDTYLGYWSEMLHLLGERFDCDPTLEFADISGYGKWGEWHHACAPGGCAPGIESEAHRAVAWRLIDDHLAALPRTPAIMMIRPYDPAARYKHDAIAYALGRGCGARRDSFIPGISQYELWQAMSGRQPGTMLIYEPGYYPEYSESLPGLPERPIDYDQIYQPLLDIGANYLGFGFNPWQAIETHEHHAAMLQRVMGRVGYRIRPAVVWMHGGLGRSSVAVGLVNDGVATPPGTLTLTVEFDRGDSVEIKLPPGAPAPGPMQMFRAALPADFRRHGNTSMSLTMSLQMSQKTYPVRWAVKEGTAADPDGRVLRTPIPGDIGWRENEVGRMTWTPTDSLALDRKKAKIPIGFVISAATPGQSMTAPDSPPPHHKGTAP